MNKVMLAVLALALSVPVLARQNTSSQQGSSSQAGQDQSSQGSQSNPSGQSTSGQSQSGQSTSGQSQAGQSTSGQASSSDQSQGQKMSGKVSQDRKTFTTSQGTSYNVSNPDALKGQENQNVALIVQVDPATNTIHILQVAPPQQ